MPTCWHVRPEKSADCVLHLVAPIILRAFRREKIWEGLKGLDARTAGSLIPDTLQKMENDQEFKLTGAMLAYMHTLYCCIVSSVWCDLKQTARSGLMKHLWGMTRYRPSDPSCRLESCRLESNVLPKQQNEIVVK